LIFYLTKVFPATFKVEIKIKVKETVCFCCDHVYQKYKLIWNAKIYF